MLVSVVNRIEDIPAERWNRVAGTQHPFLRHEFLSALERHECVGEKYGWLPHHLLAHDDNDGLVAAVPLYLKNNSYGEFVFDWSWADAYQRNGKRYYPKLVSAIPYTPVTGPRLLVSPHASRQAAVAALIDRAHELTQQTRCSSLHWLFTNQSDTESLMEHGFMRRSSCHFHWHNEGYGSFDDFLSRLTSRKRKKIRRERRHVTDAGIRMKILPGNEASEGDWQIMHEFYRSTFEKKSGIPTLSLDFFLDISQSMGQQIVLVFAYLDRQAVAGTINLRSDTALYGRHWGALREFNSLHFETCYYQGIDYCIEQGLELFEPGAQGEHKISRGFLPTLTSSAHWIEDEQFRSAIGHYLAQEHAWMLDYSREMQGYSPFRKHQGNGKHNV